MSFGKSWEGLRASWEGLRAGWKASELPGKASEPPGKALEPAGRASELAGRASEPPVKASVPAGRAPEPAGRAPEPAGRAPELAGRALELAGTAPEPTGRALEPAGKPGDNWEAREGDGEKKTEHSYYMLVPEVIVPYGTAAQKVMRRGYAGQKMGIFGVNVAQWVCIQLLCQREAREALWIPKLNRPDRGTV